MFETLSDGLLSLDLHTHEAHKQIKQGSMVLVKPRQTEFNRTTGGSSGIRNSRKLLRRLVERYAKPEVYGKALEEF